MSNESINDYVPFGPEWEKEVMKLSKANLVQMYRSANIHSQSIEKERDELKAWKAEALLVMPDFQTIGKLLGIKLGQTVHDKIIPGIKELIEERDRYKQALMTLFP